MSYFPAIQILDGRAGGTARAPVDAEDGVAVQFGAVATSDAFGRLRVSEPTSLFQSKLIADNQPLFWDDAATSGTGTSSTHSANTASVKLKVSSGTAGTRVRQTKRRFPYQAGKGQQVLVTFTLGAKATGVTRRVGYFDDSNGLFLEQTSTLLKFVRRTYAGGSASDTSAVDQADWNLDTLDGSGDADNPSGIELDDTDAQILVIAFEWLGVGSVWMGFVIDGKVHYCHRFDHANEAAGVYMSTPNLPVRYEIAGTAGTGANAELECICAAVSSEGGAEFVGTQRVADRGTTALTTLNDADLYPLVAIRLRAGYFGANVRVSGISILNASTTVYRWALILNPTVTGTALSFTEIVNSAIEADVARTNGTKVSAGTVVASGYGSSSTTLDSVVEATVGDIGLGAKIDGTADVLVLAIQRVTGTTETFYGGITWQESI